jgi:hypothetical protein
LAAEYKIKKYTPSLTRKTEFYFDELYFFLDYLLMLLQEAAAFGVMSFYNQHRDNSSNSTILSSGNTDFSE